MNTNLNVQYQLAQDVVVEVGYSGSLSRHLPDTLDINQIPIGSPEAVTSRPYYSQFPYLAAINEVQSVGNGNFNGLLASLRTTSFHGFTTKLSYTFGHSMDDLSYARGIIPQNSYCLSAITAIRISTFAIRFPCSWPTAVPAASQVPRSLRRLAVEYLVLFLHRHALYRPFRQRFQRHRPSSLTVRRWSATPLRMCPPLIEPPVPITGSIRRLSRRPLKAPMGMRGVTSFYGPSTRQIDFSVFKNIRITEHVRASVSG